MVGQLLKERICSSRSKFFPLRVDPISDSYLIQRSKQKFMQVNKTLFSEKRRGGGGGGGRVATAGAFIRTSTDIDLYFPFL